MKLETGKIYTTESGVRVEMGKSTNGHWLGHFVSPTEIDKLREYMANRVTADLIRDGGDYVKYDEDGAVDHDWHPLFRKALRIVGRDISYEEAIFRVVRFLEGSHT